MRHAKTWVCGLVVGLTVAGAAMVLLAPVAVRAEPKAEERLKDHWRHHDGHWSYWCEEDKMWYYTDGERWFVSGEKGWEPYRFDHKFGKEGFERGEYKIPERDEKIVLPKHEVWHPRK